MMVKDTYNCQLQGTVTETLRVTERVTETLIKNLTVTVKDI